MAGKGDKWRKGTNYQKYYNSPFWEKWGKDDSEVLTQPEEETPKMYLYLDDVRHPSKTYLWDDGCFLSEKVKIPPSRWYIVRSYEAFVRTVETHGVPDVVSFDNDLHDFTNSEFTHQQVMDSLQMVNWRESKIKTGAHCAEWLVKKCEETNSPIPEYYVHSANGRARTIIRQIMEEAKERNCSD